jgi:hypothetical protein
MVGLLLRLRQQQQQLQHLRHQQQQRVCTAATTPLLMRGYSCGARSTRGRSSQVRPRRPPHHIWCGQRVWPTPVALAHRRRWYCAAGGGGGGGSSEGKHGRQRPEVPPRPRGGGGGGGADGGSNHALVLCASPPPVRALPFELGRQAARTAFLDWAQNHGALESVQPSDLMGSVRAQLQGSEGPTPSDAFSSHPIYAPFWSFEVVGEQSRYVYAGKTFDPQGILAALLEDVRGHAMIDRDDGCCWRGGWVVVA